MTLSCSIQNLRSLWVHHSLEMAPLSPLSLIVATLLLARVVTANCECGYTVGSSLYTELLETDFLHTNVSVDPDWAPQNYTVTPAASNGPYGKNASVTNVVSNLLPANDWMGDGSLGGTGGLQLWVRGGIPKDGLVPMAECAATREDMLYGSYRASMKLSGVNGSCGAFFWYYNNTQEIDMEFLSREFNSSTSGPVNLVLQSPAAAEAGDNAANTPTFVVFPLPFAPDAEFHEYRFDWSPGYVTFFADGTVLSTMTQAVPTAPGHISLIHWSNGNTGWSGGPPETDAVLTVQYVKSYFNSSSITRQEDWGNRCTNITAPNATCAVPELTSPPDSNSSTPFFIYQANSTVNQSVYDPLASTASGFSRVLLYSFTSLLLSSCFGLL